MASDNENGHVGLVELEELEVMEIDEALLREFLEEKGDVRAEGECLVQSVETGNKVGEEIKEEIHKKVESYSEKQEGNKGVNDMMEILEPASQNEMILNWYPDDTIGMMADFGFAIGDPCSQICEGLVSDEAYHGCFWEDM